MYVRVFYLDLFLQGSVYRFGQQLLLASVLPIPFELSHPFKVTNENENDNDKRQRKER